MNRNSSLAHYRVAEVFFLQKNYQSAANAYRELRRVQHRARLNEEPTQVGPQELLTEREAVLALGDAVFHSLG